jgi:alpha-amylase/alpha-mannosidase (GH57 family)
MPQTYLMLLWHMHQPFYKDIVQDSYTMPWVRLHALKDYFGMVRILREFPSVHATFNMVPSLVAQIQDYAWGTAREPAFEVARKPAERLSTVERENLFNYAFAINRTLLDRHPRFRELYDKVTAVGSRSLAAQLAANQEILDLQVLSQLAWFDEFYLGENREVRALAGKQRGYTERDKKEVFDKENELLNAVLREYRELGEAGQIEVSTSPFYHPILPLLCDTDVAAESRPGVTLPRRPFRHPEDARHQLQAAIALHEQVFGKRPRGLWPSEGSVSDEVLSMAAAEGFRWAATDEGVLGRSRMMGFYRHADGTVSGGHELYRPHRFARSPSDPAISIFFRDHHLSDLIGFVYSRMDPHAAAADLHHRIKAAALSTGSTPAVVSVILDGENCWEHYPQNGRDFLRSFYGRLAADPDMQAVTATEALDVTSLGTLNHVVPGSWISANFDVWIGAGEDNCAWDLLNDARDFFSRATRKSADIPREKLEQARHELWIAEGSDWCWWYGPEHSSDQDEEFDLLYRKHLSNIYHLLGGHSPDALAVPIKRPRGRPLHVAPTALVDPRVDGFITNYFEWMGAGFYCPDHVYGSMHGAAHSLDALHYSLGPETLLFRIDFSEGFLEHHPEFEVRVNLEAAPGGSSGTARARLYATARDRKLESIRYWSGENEIASRKFAGQLEVGLARILEVRLNLLLIQAERADEINLQLSLWVHGLPIEVFPQEGWLNIQPLRESDYW